LTDDRGDAKSVNISEWSTPKGWETNTEHGADVAVANVAKNAFLEAERRLVDHRQHTATDHLLGGMSTCLSARAAGTDDLIDGTLVIP
jgi:hypothetical protein